MTLKLDLDPRSRLIVVFVLSSLAVILQDLYVFALLTIITFLAMLILGGDFLAIKKMRRYIWVFGMMIVIQSMFSSHTQVLLQLGPVTILSWGGIEKGLLLIFRILIIVLSATLLLGCDPRKLVQGLIQWKIPYEIAFMVQLGIRFLPLLREEVSDTITAIQLRGIELNQVPIKRRIRVYTSLLMPTLTGVIVKAQQLSTAMEMKAFRAAPYRTSYFQLQYTRADFVVMVSSTFLLAGMLFLHFNR